LLRFVAFALPLLVLTLGVTTFALETVGFPVGGELLGPGRALPHLFQLGTWLLEAAGLTALFLILQGRTSSSFLDGLLCGWIAWIFRGPLLVLTVVAVTRRSPDPWWSMALSWLMLYTLCGVVLALLARGTRLQPEP
jgi:hypothetical protein